MSILLKNAYIFDGKALKEEKFDILIEDNKIKHIVPSNNNTSFNAKQVYNLDEKIVSVGFIDIHTHLRDPGYQWQEDITTGAKAAAFGGYTAVVAMPNTNPPIDNHGLIKYVIEKGKQSNGAKVLPAGCVSKNRQGKELTEMYKMAEEGAVMFTDDGNPVTNSMLLRNALLYAKDIGITITEHPEDKSLTEGACLNEGYISAITGLKGMPNTAEAIDVYRCILLAKELDTHIHITHISTKESVEAIRQAKSKGIKVTCDTTPHHLVFDETIIEKSGFDAVYKVNPPLRTKKDIDALWEGLSDGTIDIIATDHAPYHKDEKDLPFEAAAFGIASLECAVAVVFNAWHKRNRPFSLKRLLELFTVNPVSILPKHIATNWQLKEGNTANITVIDTDRLAKVDVSNWRSKAYSSPYDGHLLKGWPVMTIVDGKIVFKSEDI